MLGAQSKGQMQELPSKSFCSNEEAEITKGVEAAKVHPASDYLC